MTATLKFIGHINTPYDALKDCPRNVDLNGLDCLNGTPLLDIKPAILHEDNNDKSGQ